MSVGARNKPTRRMTLARASCTMVLLIALKCRIVFGTCHAKDGNPYLYAGTKTPYRFVHGTITNTSVPNCEPVQIWMLIRHGTRYPKEKTIRSMRSKLPELQRSIIENHEKRGSGELCDEDVENLKAWRLNENVDPSRPEYLAETGVEELESLGSRFRNYLPMLLQGDDAERKERYEFVSSNTQRTILSMRSFANGLSGMDYAGHTESRNGTVGSKVLTSLNHFEERYKICNRQWRKEPSEPGTNEEVDDWFNGPEFKKLIADVSRRLGFPGNLPLEDVWLMEKMCAFDRAWKSNETSPWCAAFLEEDLRMFEYEDDIHSYYNSGYGAENSLELGCPLVKDMFNRFLNLENGKLEDEPRGIFYFNHNKLLKTFYRSVGIGRDPIPLKASNYKTMGNRKWRNTFLTPFAGNFAAIFYKCDSSYKLRFYLAENELRYEGCNAGVCDWSRIKELWGPIAFNCQSSFCQDEAP